MLSPEEKSMCHPNATEHMEEQNEEEDTDSDKTSLQWEDFFGSSLDLVPILLDMYDSLVAKNHEEENGQPPVPYSNGNRRASRISNQKQDLISRSESVPCNNDREKFDFEPPQSRPNYSRRNSASLNNFCKVQTLHEVDGERFDFNMCVVNDLERTSFPTTNSQNGTLDSGFMDQASLVNADSCGSQWTVKEDARPLSISSTSSSTSSSSSLTRHTNSKKSYLASIESLDDDELSEDADEGKLLNGRSNAFHPFVSPSHTRGPSVSLSYIDRVILEIIETERTYVKDTSEIIEGYLYFVRNQPELGISDDDINDLFGNIEVIYLFNKNFLTDLEQCGFDPVKIAHCFVTHNEGFTVYTHYCTNYPRTVSVLTELMRKPATAKIFRERQAILGHTLPLGSFLLKPVQRILKYHLLLQNIVKYYDPKQSGYEVIFNALATMTGMAHHINDMKRKHEHAVRVQEIQSLLYGWEGQDLTTYGELVAEGMFRVFGAKGIRHVFLFDKMLLIAKKKEGGFLSYKTHIMCSNLMLIESVPGEPLSFHVIPFDNPRVQYTLQSRSLEQKREWTLQLKRVILENYDAIIPYHARQLVMQLGQNKTDEDVLIEKNLNARRQHSAPEYLERRKHENRRKSEGGINKALKLKRGSKKSDQEIQSPYGESHTTNDSKENKEKVESKKLNHCLKHKDKKYKGWRRKSEPTDFMSSKESLATSHANERMQNQGTILEDLQPSSKPEAKCASKFAGTYANALTMFDTFLHSNGKRRSPTRNRYSDRASSVGEPSSLTSPESVSISSLELDDPSSDYVTFYFAQEQLQRNASNAKSIYSSSEENVESGHSSLNSTVVCSPESSSRLAVNHLNKTSSFAEQKTTNGSSNLHNVENDTSPNSSLRRTQSFNHQSNSTLSLQGERRSFRARPNFLNLNGGNQTRRKLWLKPEDLKHLDSEKRKSDSLPKSFQVNADSPSSYCQTKEKKSKIPFNSSHLKRFGSFSRSDFNINDLESSPQGSSFKASKNCFSVRKDDKRKNPTTGCSNTPSESLEDICTTFHPEHKIYRSSFSKTSLKNMLTNVSSRLANLKLGSSMNIDESSRSNLALDPDGKEFISRGRSRERTSKKLMFSVARMYSKMIKQRLRLKSDKDFEFGIAMPVSQSSLPFYKQGSPAIGARMASPIVQNNANGARFRLSAAKRDAARPDSVLSISSSITSSSDGDKTSGIGGSLDNATTPSESQNNLQLCDGEGHDSDGSADSYYERSFEAIEGMLESEIFRDSAIYSDPEDLDLPNESRKSTLNRRVPPPKPAKPFSLAIDKKSFSTTTTPEFEHISIHDKLKGRRVRGHCIMERLRHLEKCTQSSPERDTTCARGFKSVKQRRKELEMWHSGGGGHREADESETSSQHSTSTINTVVEFPSTNLSPTSTTDSTSMKGWVRHVVGKFQEKNK